MRKTRLETLTWGTDTCRGWNTCYLGGGERRGGQALGSSEYTEASLQEHPVNPLILKEGTRGPSQRKLGLQAGLSVVPPAIG